MAGARSRLSMPVSFPRPLSKSPPGIVLLWLIASLLLQQVVGSTDDAEEDSFEDERGEANDWAELDIDTSGRVFPHVRHTVSRSATGLLGARLRQERRMLAAGSFEEEELLDATTGQFYGFGEDGDDPGSGLGTGTTVSPSSAGSGRVAGAWDSTDGCVERADVEIINHLTVYKVGAKLAGVMSAGDTFDLKTDADCTGRPWATGVTATPIVNSSDPLRSSSAVFHLSRPPPSGLSYVCWTSDKPGLPRCAASIERGPPKTPLRILIENIPIADTEDHIRLMKHIDELEEMWDLIVVQWLFLIAVAVWIVSIIHACYVVTTVRNILPSREILGLKSSDTESDLLGSLFMMLTFATGVTTMVSLSLKIMFTDVEQWLVDSILATASLAGLLGIILLYRDMCTRQLFHAALKHGVCITSERRIGIGDLLVLSGLMLVSGFILLGVMSLPEYPQELSGCVSGFLGVVKVLQQLLEGRRKRRNGICEVKLVTVAKAVRALDGEIKKDGASSSASESPTHHEDLVGPNEGYDETSEQKPLHIVDLMREQPIMHIDMYTFCQSCRSRVDPLVQMEKQLKEMGDSQGLADEDGEVSEVSDLDSSTGSSKSGAYQIPDFRWHAHYVHAKTGSIAPHFNLVVALGMMVYMLFHLLTLLFRYRTLAPSLINLSSPVGVLVPPFHPEIREYTYLHDRGLQSFPFFAEGNEEMVRRKDFWVNNQLVAKQNVSEHVDISASEQPDLTNRYPMQLRLNVLGGIGSRSTDYRIGFSEVTVRVTTMMITVGRWRRCVFWGYRKDLVAAIPKITRSDRIVNIELATLALAADVPRAIDERGTVKEPGLVTFFKKLPGANYSVCYALCRGYSECIKSKAGESGCYFGLWPAKSNNCTEMHNSGKAVQEGSPMAELQKVRWLRASLCSGWDTSLGCKSSYVSPNGKMMFRDVKLLDQGHSFFALKMMNEKGIKTAQQKELWSQEIRLSQGAPLPRRVFVAGPKFIKLVRTRVQDDLMTIALAPYDVQKCPAMFQIVVAPLGDDPAFDMFFTDSTKKTIITEASMRTGAQRGLRSDDVNKDVDEDGNELVGGAGYMPPPLPDLETLDLSLCDPKYKMRHIWLCNNLTSGKVLPYMVLTVEKYRPTKTMAAVVVRPKPDEPGVQQIEESRLRIAVRTEDGKVPLRWGVERNCQLDLLDAPVQVVPSLLGANILEQGLLHCPNITLMLVDENNRTVINTFSVARLLGVAVQLHKVSSWIARFLEAVSNNPYDVIERSLGARSEGWEKLGVTGARHGISIGTDHLKEACGIFSTMSFPDGTVDISWVTLLLHVTPGSNFWWEFLKLGAGFISPADIAAAMGFLPEATFYEILPIIQTGLFRRDGDFKSPHTSPTIIAVQRRWPDFLRVMLEVLPHVLFSGVGTTVWASYYLWEFAFEYDCGECLDVLADTYHYTQETCTDTTIEKVFVANTPRDIVYQACGSMPKRNTDLSVFSVLTVRRPQDGNYGRVGQMVQRWFQLYNSSDSYSRVRALDFRTLDAKNEDLADLLLFLHNISELRETLEGIYFDDNRFDFCSSPNSAAPIARLLEVAQNVRTISLARTRVCDEGFMVMVPALTNLSQFGRLTMVDTRITTASVKAISEIPTWSNTLKNLDISDNEIGLQGVLHLCKGLNMVATLMMENIGLTDADDYEIVESTCAGKWNWLSALHVSNNQLGNSGFRQFLAIAAQRPVLRIMDASNIGIFKEGLDVEAFRSMKLPAIRRLTLSDNSLGAKGPELSAIFGGCQELDLSNTGLTRADAPAVVAMFKRHPELSHLNLSSNELQTEGLEEIVRGLVNSPHGFFGHLYAANTGVEGPFVEDLLNALGDLKNLKSLDLSNNRFDFMCLQQTKFAKLRSMESLKLNKAIDFIRDDVTRADDGDGPLGEADPISMFDFLKHWRALKVLEIDNNGLRPQGMHSLLYNICHHNHAIRTLSFKSAAFDVKDVEDLGSSKGCRAPALKLINADFSLCDLKRLEVVFPKRVAVNSDFERLEDCED